jgi:hypothetical protein
MTVAKWGLTIALATLIVTIIGVVVTWVASGGSSVTADHGSVAVGHDANTSATNCGIAAGHDATGNVVNCGYPEEKMRLELMQAELDEVLRLVKQLAANSTASTTASPNISVAETDISLAEFEREFPLGFAIFYSNGKSIKYATKRNSSSGGVSFDPSGLEVTKEGTSYCMNGVPVLFNGRPPPIHVHHVCVGSTGSTARLANFNEVAIDIKPLETSGDKAAWVVGAS